MAIITSGLVVCSIFIRATFCPLSDWQFTLIIRKGIPCLAVVGLNLLGDDPCSGSLFSSKDSILILNSVDVLHDSEGVYSTSKDGEAVVWFSLLQL